MWRTSLRSSRGDERIALDEPLGQPDDAELEAAAELDGRPGAARDLDAAAADVDDDRDLAGDADAVDRRQVDQPRFFGAGDDPRRGCRSAAVIGLQELAAVFGFARRRWSRPR